MQPRVLNLCDPQENCETSIKRRKGPQQEIWQRGHGFESHLEY